MFVATAALHFREDSAVAERVDDLLGGTAEQWYRHRSRVLDDVRSGDWCLYIDTVDNDVAIVSVTDVLRDGAHVVFAHELLSDDCGWRPFTKRLQASFIALGLRRTSKSIAGQWIPPEQVPVVARLLYPDAQWDDAERGDALN